MLGARTTSPFVNASRRQGLGSRGDYLPYDDIAKGRAMDDPLNTKSHNRYALTALQRDFMKSLKFGAAPSLRYFDSGGEGDEDRVVSDGDALDEILQQAIISEGVEGLKESSLPAPCRGLKLIIGSGDARRQELSLQSQDFMQIMDVCKFPKTFTQSILAHNGSFARFTEYEEVNGKHLPSVLSVILQTPYSPLRNFSCVIRVNIVDRSAVCLFFEKNNLVRDRSHIDDLLKRLQISRASLHTNPLSFIGVLFEEHGYSCEKYRAELDKDVVEMESQTGHTSISISLFRPNPDYENLTRDLNACKTSLIFMDSITSFENELGAFCKETLETLEILRLERGLDALPLGERVAAMQQIDYHLNLSHLRRIQACSLDRRVQTQISVLYSLISQRDSKINIIVAEDSKKIAMAAKRDSTAMKTISVLTMAFLPGTFVASVFSAGIFDFQGAADNSVVRVSSGWWVYFVVTIILTLVTVVVWACYLKWRSNENIKEIEQLEKMEVNT